MDPLFTKLSKLSLWSKEGNLDRLWGLALEREEVVVKKIYSYLFTKHICFTLQEFSHMTALENAILQ